MAAFALERVSRFVSAGGVVMWPLLALGLVVWYLLLQRTFGLRRGLRTRDVEALVRGAAALPAPRGSLLAEAVRQVRLLTEQASRGTRVSEHDLELSLRSYRLDAGQHARAVRSMVAAAPLLGLLGTVMGMIETFESLQDMALYAEAGGGVAGGISAALTTTEMGLGIAIPALLVERLLQAKERRIRRELDQIQLIAERLLLSGEREEAGGLDPESGAADQAGAAA